MTDSPFPSTDVHLGASPAEILSAMAHAFTAVHDAVADLQLRPTALEVHTQLGFVDVAVYFPSSDVAAVDAVADRFALPPHDGGLLYTRAGLTELGDLAGTLVVRCTRPGVDLPDPLAAAAPVPADTPTVITGELAAVPAPLALPAGAPA